MDISYYWKLPTVVLGKESTFQISKNLNKIIHHRQNQVPFSHSNGMSLFQITYLEFKCGTILHCIVALISAEIIPKTHTQWSYHCKEGDKEARQIKTTLLQSLVVARSLEAGRPTSQLFWVFVVFQVKNNNQITT